MGMFRTSFLWPLGVALASLMACEDAADGGALLPPVFFPPPTLSLLPPPPPPPPAAPSSSFFLFFSPGWFHLGLSFFSLPCRWLSDVGWGWVDGRKKGGKGQARLRIC
jgi:hypothetical protein